jgi:hypothetical protein
MKAKLLYKSLENQHSSSRKQDSISLNLISPNKFENRWTFGFARGIPKIIQESLPERD